MSLQFNADTIRIGAGTALLPAVTPQGDPNTGVWSPGADTLAIATAGVEAVRWNSSQQTIVPMGALGTPSIAFLGDENTGIFQPIANQWQAVANGSAVMTFSATSAVSLLFHSFQDGSAALPRIRFFSDANTGIFRPGADQLSVTAGGAERVRWDDNTTASETPMLLDVAGGGVLRVSVGAADSGGAGFRLLRVPN